MTRDLAAKEYRDTLAQNNIQMWKMALPMLGIPMFIGFFIALRRLAANMESFQTGGMLWFQDLSLADPTYILPVVSTSLQLITFEVAMRFGSTAMDTSRVPNNLMKYIQWGLRGVFVLMLPMVAGFPTALFCYWITNGLFSLFQTVLFKWPVTQRMLGIPVVILNQKQQLQQQMNPSGVEKFVGNLLPSVGKNMAQQRTANVKVLTQEELARSKSAASSTDKPVKQ